MKSAPEIKTEVSEMISALTEKNKVFANAKTTVVLTVHKIVDCHCLVGQGAAESFVYDKMFLTSHLWGVSH